MDKFLFLAKKLGFCDLKEDWHNFGEKSTETVCLEKMEKLVSYALGNHEESCPAEKKDVLQCVTWNLSGLLDIQTF